MKSAIERLQTPLRSKALQKISANANSAGGSPRQTNGRARKDSLSALANRLGIFPIEQRVTGALAASVGGANGPVASVTIGTNAGTPATTAITTNELDAVTWAGAGTKTLTVSAPADLKGEALVKL